MGEIAAVGIYKIHLPLSGGKAGKGKNITTSIQIRMDNRIVKTFRVEATSKSISAGIQKVKTWCSSNPIGPID